eukprot:TRINITY_DN12152_c0_g4_i1.p1 TRINITY_DN12152_c0_g4~~TRINITY_DN12152_c0_g4_i1.p1  ORF type:complete len:503 (+),score=114.20 TRINITY_DN12152_c0_g4_i1:158-1666(+)
MGRVVMVRSLPQGTDDTDLVRLGSCVARVLKAMVLKTKNMGFIEFSSSTAAQAFLERADREGMMVKFQQVHCGPSTHSEISHGSALTVTDQLLVQLGIIPGAAVRAMPSGAGGQPVKAGCVLEVSLQGLLMPVRIDDLHAVFSQYGRVERVQSERRDGRTRNLVQMASAAEAVSAQAALNGKFMQCATFVVSQAVETELAFRHDSHHRDYTRVGPPPANPLNPFTIGHGLVGMNPIGPPAPPNPGYMPYPLPGVGAVQSGALAHMQMPGMAEEPRGDPGIVLICSGLTDKLTLNHLWELAGRVGDIHTIKLMYTQHDKCLMHFSKGGQEAREMLDGLRVCDATLRVSLSNQTAPMKILPNDAGLIANKDTHRKHRFNPQNAAVPSENLHVSVQNRGGGPADVPSLREALVSLFREHGTVAGFEQFKQKRHLCIVRMDSLTSALNAMVALHGMHVVLGDGHNVVLSIGFSKHTIEPTAPLSDAPDTAGLFTLLQEATREGAMF